MSLVAPSQVSPQDQITAASVNTPVNQITAVINGNIDNTNLADAAITASKITAGAVTPIATNTAASASWDWTDYGATSVINGWSTVAYKYIRYCLIGKTCFVNFAISGTSNSGNASFTVPFNSKKYSIGGGNFLAFDAVSALVVDNGTVQNIPGRMVVDPSVSLTSIQLSKSPGISFTTSGLKEVRGQFNYEIE